MRIMSQQPPSPGSSEEEASSVSALALAADPPVNPSGAQFSLSTDPDLLVEFILVPIGSGTQTNVPQEVKIGPASLAEQPSPEETAAIALTLWLLTPARTGGAHRWRRDDRECG